MLEIIRDCSGIVAVFAGASIYVGHLADDRLRLRTAAWLRYFAMRPWRQIIAESIYRIYAGIFSSSAFSFRFILRGLGIYYLLIVGSLLFLSVEFPTVFRTVTFVFELGQPLNIALWLAGVLSSGLVFLLANAQTLYFLQILRETPTTSKFLLISYSDILVTASITALGVVSVHMAYAYATISTARVQMPLTISFIADDKQADKRMQFNTPHNDAILSAARAKFGVLEENIKSNPATGRITNGGDKIEAFNSTGSVNLWFNRPDPKAPYHKGNYAHPADTGTACAKFLDFPENHMKHTRYSLTVQDISKIEETCVKGGSLTLDMDHRANVANIDLRGTASYLIGNIVAGFVESLTTGFRQYQSADPMEFKTNHIHSSDDKSVPYGQILIDDWGNDYLISSYGGGNFSNIYYASNNTPSLTLPLGSMNFAMMATTFTTLLGLIFIFITFPLFTSFAIVRRYSYYLQLKSYPFRWIGAIGGIWLAFLYAIVAVW